jgi:hypothetical protein
VEAPTDFRFERHGEETLLTPQLPISPDLSAGGVSSRADRLPKNPICPPTLRDNSPILSEHCSHREVITRAAENLDHDGEERVSQAFFSKGTRSITTMHELTKTLPTKTMLYSTCWTELCRRKNSDESSTRRHERRHRSMPPS